MQNITSQPPILEITIISAQGLRSTSALLAAFSRRLRPFITLSAASTSGRKSTKVYKTRVDDKGGVNPAWGDRFRIILDQAFFYQRYAGIYLQLYTKHLLLGRAQLGWCLIPAADIVGRFPTLMGSSTTRFLSYRLRAGDGSRRHGVVHVAVRIEGSLSMLNPPMPIPLVSTSSISVTNLQETHDGEHLTMGIPVEL